MTVFALLLRKSVLATVCFRPHQHHAAFVVCVFHTPLMPKDGSIWAQPPRQHVAEILTAAYAQGRVALWLYLAHDELRRPCHHGKHSHCGSNPVLRCRLCPLDSHSPAVCCSQTVHDMVRAGQPCFRSRSSQSLPRLLLPPMLTNLPLLLLPSPLLRLPHAVCGLPAPLSPQAVPPMRIIGSSRMGAHCKVS